MKNKIFIFFLLILGISSCKEDFLDLKNPAADDSGTYFTTAQTVTQSVNAIYQTMSTEALFARKWFFTFDLLSNEGAIRQPAGAEFQELSMGVYDATSGPVTGMWKMFYRMVTRSNFALDKLKAWNPKNADEIALKTRLEGEAHFFQGFANYYLATLWGNVPMRKSFEETTSNTNAVRAPQADVYAFAEENLKLAIERLPSRYSNEDNGRATSWAAKTFLGRVYAQQGLYDKALLMFKDVADNGGFSMWEGLAGFEKQFTKENRNSPETIFDCKFYFAGDPNQWFIFWGGDEAANVICTTSARAMEYGFTAWWNVAMAPPAVKRFKYDVEGAINYVDPRAFNTFYGNAGFGGDTLYYTPEKGVNGEVYNFISKGNTWSWKKYEEFEWKVQESPNSEISNQIARLADVKLMVAECLIMTGKNNEAIPYINSVRQRVGAIPYTSLPADKNAAMNIVKHEREIELCGEQQRWFDLVRWHKNWPGFNMITLLNQEKISAGVPVQANFQDKHVLFPIPQSEKDVNYLCEVPNGWN